MSKKSLNATLNMTEGNIVRLLLIFSLPMLIGNIFQQVYNLADSIIVGRLVGANALGAIGATSSITFFFFALCNGIGQGGGIITAQFFGSDNEHKVKQCIVNTGYIMTIFPFIVGIIAAILSGPLLKILGTPEEIFADARWYTLVMCVGLLFVSIYNYISNMLRALGDSKTPLYFLIFACLLNVALDFLFVYCFKMGVIGAGIATVIAQFVAGGLCAIFAFKTNHYFKFEKYDLKFRKDIVWSVLRLGIPLSLQYSLIAVSTMAMQKVVNSFGPVAVAAFTATGRVEQLIQLPYQTLGASESTFCGQNYGANKNDRVLAGYRKSVLIMTIFTVIMMPLMMIFARPMVSIFVSEKAVIDMGATAIRIGALFYLFLGMIYVVRGILNGIGDAFFALLNGGIEVLGRFTVPFILTAIPAIGVWGIWWSVGIVWFMSGFSAWLRYRYYRKKLIYQ